MAEGFGREENVAESVRRMLLDGIGGALSLLVVDRGPAKQRYHHARRDLKKARALLRLARGAVGDREYRRENERCRDAGRVLSAVRDAQVLVDTFDKLAEHFPDELPPGQRMRVRRNLAAFGRRRAALEERRSRAGAGAARTLRTALTEVEEMPIDSSGWKAIEPGLRRTYRDGRLGLARATGEPLDAHFHEWRKSVKYLRHQLQLLSRCWREPLRKVIDELKALSDRLGDDHDLAVLRQVLSDERASLGDADAVDTLIALGLRRQQQLREEALPLGQRLFAEKPKAFTGRLHAYWNAWRSP